MSSEDKWAYDEPGLFGGHSQTVITEAEIIQHQMNRTDVRYTDEQTALSDFITVHGCYDYEAYCNETTESHIQKAIADAVREAEERQRERCAKVYEQEMGKPYYDENITYKAILNAGGKGDE